MNGYELRDWCSVPDRDKGVPTTTRSTIDFRPVHSPISLKSAPLSLAARQLKNEVENSFVSSAGVEIIGAVPSRPTLLHAVVFMLLT